MNKIKVIEADQIRSDLPDFSIGDTLKKEWDDATLDSIGSAIDAAVEQGNTRGADRLRRKMWALMHGE